MTKKYDIAISFAGEERKLAEQISDILSATGYNVFYDGYVESELWGSELPVMLGEVYGGQARFCLMIVSKSYIEKMWANHERKFAIQEMMKSKSEYILPLKVDNLSIPGIPDTIAYVNLQQKNPHSICELIMNKIGNPHFFDPPTIDESDIEIIKKIINHCYTRAIFSKMDSEITLDAMFKSIEFTVSLVRQLIPQINSQYIQTITLKIVTQLDSIERYRNLPRGYYNSLEAENSAQVDTLKLDLIKFLHTLRREARLSIQLPIDTGYHHFFTIRDALNSPDSTDDDNDYEDD